MAAVLPPWPHPAAATETHVRFCGKDTITVEPKPSDQPCTVRLRSDLVLSHGLRGVGGRYFGVTTDRVARALDHRVGVRDAAVLRSVEACSDLIHSMLAEAPVTAEYDLAAGNWMDSSTDCTPLDIAIAIVTYVCEEIDAMVDIDDMDFVAPSLHFDVHMPQLRVTLVYSEPKALLLACKEAAAAAAKTGAPATGRKRRRESGKACAICMVDEDASWDEETVALPCSHAFHSGCILTWFHRAPTCPTCRLDIMECFSFVRSSAPPEQFTDDVAEDELDRVIGFLAHGERLVGPADTDEQQPVDSDPEEDEFIDSDPEEDEFIDSDPEEDEQQLVDTGRIVGTSCTESTMKSSPNFS
ncbi:hypothetical protein CFC21_049764 [Triticum aestivum]|uniref:RING-type domain-containing protein n=2 Tax=Triticum aestivum TaxID=4565 RepID=A0A9R1G2Z3_WHEAT|nr:hypothetical protein CFC21_049764 [Triticum aestivum]